jgi:hypothetical protein
MDYRLMMLNSACLKKSFGKIMKIVLIQIKIRKICKYKDLQNRLILSAIKLLKMSKFNNLKNNMKANILIFK